MAIPRATKQNQLTRFRQAATKVAAGMQELEAAAFEIAVSELLPELQEGDFSGEHEGLTVEDITNALQVAQSTIEGVTPEVKKAMYRIKY